MKLKAFTIVEIIVVMLITAVVVGASMLLYRNINQLQYRSFVKGAENADLVLLVDVLRKDCNEAKTIHYQGETLFCIKETENVSYELLSQEIIRKAGVTDTFPFGCQDIEIRFGDKEQQMVSIISFQLNLRNDSIPFYYYKQYGAMFLENENQ